MTGVATVLGAGSWGTALALLLAETGEVRLWEYSAERAERLARERENLQYLPGHPFPPTLITTNDLAGALNGASLVVLAVPSGAAGKALTEAASYLSTDVILVLASKGIDPVTLELPADVAARLVPGRPVVAISGPNLAREVACGVPTAAVAASESAEVATIVAERFNRPTFRTYVSGDIRGVELGGAVKNVLAIAGGVSDGLGYGDNTKAALLTRGLSEMARLGNVLGAKRETFYGLAGVGDLIATAASRLSRNWRVGNGLAQGKSLPQILTELGQVAEGVPSASAVSALAERYNLDLPVCASVHALLQGQLTPAEAVERLTVGRSTRFESEP